MRMQLRNEAPFIFQIFKLVAIQRTENGDQRGVNGSRKISLEIFGRCPQITTKQSKPKEAPKSKMSMPTGDENT